MTSAVPFAQDIYDPARRAFLHQGRVAKLALRRYESRGRSQSLQGEYELLQRCKDVRGVPRPLEYRQTTDIEILELEFIEGRLLSELALGWITRAKRLLQLAAVLIQISLRGISHNDVRPENVLIDQKGHVYLIDFDQASFSRPLWALLRNLVGRGPGVNQVFGSWARTVFRPVRQLVVRSIPAGLLLRLRPKRPPEQVLPALPPGAGQSLELIWEAWSIARVSNASSPGVKVAYYSLEFNGFRFPGERPWEPRWQVLRSITEYSGKRVLELGCNMGLLSAFVMRYADASAALAVDRDSEILAAARRISDAFGVHPELRRVDLDDSGPWEEELADFRPDVVFALNVLNWVSEKERLIAFLGRFEEVILEGHDPVDVEDKRLKTAGFPYVDVVGVSERNRSILHARRR
jgi:serine/threonine protein kinase